MENFKRLTLPFSKYMLMWLTARGVLLLTAVVYFNNLSAQNKIYLEGTTPNLFVMYEIHSGETLSSISKQFGTEVGVVMRLNGMNNTSKLVFGEKIKVPVNSKSIQQTVQASKLNTAFVHVAQQGESLYRISLNHNKAPIDLLKKWNNLTDNTISLGQEIIVGYGNFNVVVSTTPITNPILNTTKPEVHQKPIEETNKPAVVVTPPTSVDTPEQDKPIVKIPTVEDKTDYSSVSDQGFFKTQFGKNVEGRSLQTRAGTAMTFKTASGWTDKKYYILMNDVPPGSIVKIARGSKIIYAKVLWNMGSIKENEGLDFRINSAAASMLSIAENKFPLEVTLYE